jgi:hypothetical protein
MRSVARFLLIACLAVWIGGIVFFSFVIAPAAFSQLPSILAGRMVGIALAALHSMGLVCGVIFLLATFLVPLERVRAIRAFMALMLLCTVISEFGVTAQMERIRVSMGGSIQALPAQDAGRAAFDRLHQLSVMLEGTVLLGGLVVIALLAAERSD